MCEVGDIVKIFCPIAGYDKYHLCIKAPQENVAAFFLFLNSNPNFDELFVVDCEQLPFLPASATGKTAFSFTMIPKYNRRQLRLYESRVLGRIDKALAKKLLEHAKTLTVLPSPEKRLVISALKDMAM
jgi:hypothetical protein